MSKPPVGGFDGDSIHPDRHYVVGTNTGLRSWYLADFKLPLKSMSWDFYWRGRGPHRSAMARYGTSDQTAWAEQYPQINNSVGFYGYYSLKETYPGYPPAGEVVYRITGVIEGYGRCVIGSLGFRAEVATILGFTLEDIYKYAAEYSDFFRVTSVESVVEKKNQIREYLEKKYPEVPIFDTRAEMLRMIPLSEKPNFTQYGNQEL